MPQHIKLFESWLSDIADTVKVAFTGGKAKPKFSDAQFKQEFEAGIEDLSSDTTQSKITQSGDLDKYFVVHHTASSPSTTANDIVDILNDRNLGVQWVVDRDAKVFKTFPEGMIAWHAGHEDQKDAPADLQNATAQGVEVIAKNDADVLPEQVLAVFKLLKYLGYSKDQVWGHGEVTHNKEATEGKTIVDYWRKNWEKSPAEAEIDILGSMRQG